MKWWLQSPWLCLRVCFEKIVRLFEGVSVSTCAHELVLLSFSCGTCEPNSLRLSLLQLWLPPLLLLLVPFVCSSVREQSMRDSGMQGVNLWPLTPTSTPVPLPPYDPYASDPRHPLILLSSVCAWPGCCVKSQVQVPGRLRPCGVRRTTTDQIWLAESTRGREGGGTTCVWLFWFFFLLEGQWEAFGLGMGSRIGE